MPWAAMWTQRGSVVTSPKCLYWSHSKDSFPSGHPVRMKPSAGILLSGVTSAQRGWSRTRVTATLIYKRCCGPRSTEQEIFDAQHTHDSHRTLRNAFVVIFILASQWKKGEKGTQKVTTKNANHRQLLVNVTAFLFLVYIQIITNGHLCPFLPPWMTHTSDPKLIFEICINSKKKILIHVWGNEPPPSSQWVNLQRHWSCQGQKNNKQKQWSPQKITFGQIEAGCPRGFPLEKFGILFGNDKSA